MALPYTWRATLRDGRVMVAGDKLNGSAIMSPCRDGAPFKGQLAKLELLPISGKWPEMSVELKEGEKLDYGVTIDNRIMLSRELRALGASMVVVKITRLGKIRVDGSKELKWATPEGEVIPFDGTLEDMIRVGLVPA